MKIKLSLTVFFIVLTLSIGLVSTSSLLTVNAQNNALSQSGNGEAEQGTGQLQASDQNGQVVSGDSSIASGNNLLCQNQDNVEELSGLDEACELDGVNNPFPPNEETAVLETTFILRASGCFPIFNGCPNPNGVVEINDLTTGQQIARYLPERETSGSESFFNRIPVGHQIEVLAAFHSNALIFGNYSPEVINVIDINNSCSGAGKIVICSFVMKSEGAHIETNFHYQNRF